MKNKATLYYCFLLLLTTIHAQKKGNFFVNNCSKLNDSTYIEKTPITNLQYNNFLNWTRRIFGVESKEYRSIIPNLSVTKHKKKYIKYRHYKKYSNHPILGLNKSQVLKFGDFKFNRLVEYLLAEKGFLVREGGSPYICDNFSVIELFGEKPKINDLEGDFTIYSSPIIRLPTKKEYQLLQTLGHNSESTDVVSITNIEQVLKSNANFFSKLGPLQELAMNSRCISCNEKLKVVENKECILSGSRIVYIFRQRK